MVLAAYERLFPWVPVAGSNGSSDVGISLCFSTASSPCIEPGVPTEIEVVAVTATMNVTLFNDTIVMESPTIPVTNVVKVSTDTSISVTWKSPLPLPDPDPAVGFQMFDFECSSSSAPQTFLRSLYFAEVGNGYNASSIQREGQALPNLLNTVIIPANSSNDAYSHTFSNLSSFTVFQIRIVTLGSLPSNCTSKSYWHVL